MVFYPTEFSGLVNRIANLTNANLDSLRLQKQTWGQQFVEAMNVNGGDIDNASTFDYVMHFLTFGWKVSHQTYSDSGEKNEESHILVF